ncbi:MAG: HNH endonuclease [Proteobacteria bacterium]|nr:HNH endonuclease [Pseudomonadota bacterium]
MQVNVGKNGDFALISQEDSNLVLNYIWCKNKSGYANSKEKGKNITMHRLIMGFPEGKFVDHINGDKLDNRRENLRILNPSENSQNQLRHKNSKNTYVGVSICKRNSKYRSRIQVGKKTIVLGTFSDEIEAAEAYDIYVCQNNLYHKLNFPEKKHQYLEKEISLKSKNTATYSGVYKKGSKYIAKLRFGGKQITVATSASEIEAAELRDEFIVVNKLTNKLNFPGKYTNFIPSKKEKTFTQVVDNTTSRILVTSRPDSILLISSIDEEKVKHGKCYISSDGYACIYIDKKHIRLSRFILDISDPNVFIDHIDGNRLNNCRSNLRISNCKENAKNKLKKANCSSKFIGVSFDKRSNKWLSSIQRDGKKYNLGLFSSEDEAAKTRDGWIKTNYPDDHYKLNF